MDWSSMFFQNWQGIVRTVIVGLLAYATLVAFLRISGKRTLAKLNAFDLVVTVALGSTLSAILLQESVALAEGATALALLILAQFAVTFLSVRSPAFAGAASGTIGLKQELGEGVASAPITDAVSALVNLGYSRDTAANAVSAALKTAGEDADASKLIRFGLKELAR